MLSGVLYVIDLSAAVVFAVTGALVASRKEMDVLGFMWLAVVTGVGGGTIRDLLLDVPVFWVQDPSPVAACLITAVVLHFTAHLIQSRYQLILWFDAAGMALVSVAGAVKGIDAGASALVAIVMGTITASAGGIVRDILGHEPSIVLRKEIYVTAAVAGACIYVACDSFGLNRSIAAVAGFCCAFTIRGLALHFGWSLPVYKPRPGRKVPPS
jgi:uncharacterized membrane protein YeiH